MRDPRKTAQLVPATLGEAVEYALARLRKQALYYGHGTDNAADEAVMLVLQVAGMDPLGAAPSPDSAFAGYCFDALQEALHRRIAHREPLPYITGRAWFAGLEFHCDPRALVPRSPVAELIVSGFLPWYAGPPPRRVLDLCCGGGSIGLAIAHYFAPVYVDLSDIDEGVLSLAEENRRLLGLESSTCVIRSDLFEAVPDVRYDIIVSNPPYVDSEDLASMPAEYHHEPRGGLEAGEDGLDFVRRILREASERLQPHGLLVVEVGNSATMLEAAFPHLPFMWPAFEHGGHGVFVLSAADITGV